MFRVLLLRNCQRATPDTEARVTTMAEKQDCQTLELQARSRPGPFSVEIGSPEGEPRVYGLTPGEALRFGSGQGAHIRLEDRAVSGLHCELIADETGVTLQDLGSKNGVFVGGARVQQARLAGDVTSFVIGRSIVTVRSGTAPQVSGACALPGIIGSSEPMLRVAQEVRRHAATRAPILIQGESGTGKDLVARAVHALGRPGGPYVPLNVGAIAESLADSELFGHRRGAFTGAVAHRHGAFEQAHRGTLFLDEVAELSAGVQVRLLRVVEDGSVRPIGAQTSTQVDVRIVSASWASLSARVTEGKFRGDLFHRLSTVTLELPPLRQRRSDIPALARALLARLAPELGPKQLSPAALALLNAYDWPGNVRELSGVLYRAASASNDAEILPAHLTLHAREAGPSGVRDVGQMDPRALLARHSGNISAAARAARLPRTTFRALLTRCELSSSRKQAG